MRFMLVDDDEAIRFMLREIIDDYDLGEIAFEAETGMDIDNALLSIKKIDILIIDMLMPLRDGIQTIKAIKKDFTGKIIMLSQVESKELVGSSYLSGVDYYITKPINRNEVLSVIRSVSEHIQLRDLVHSIETNLHTVLRPHAPLSSEKIQGKETIPLLRRGEILLSTLGISGEAGSRDLLAMLDLQQEYEQLHGDFPCLKVIFNELAAKRCGASNLPEIQKEAKALEQRLRRTIFQALVSIASIGIVDYTNPKFEDYAAKFFDFAEVHKVMKILDNNEKPTISQIHINSKKFIKVFFMECKE
jgi:two-component system response regulator YcbB